MSAPLILPDPGCSFGYPLGQVAKLLSDEERYGEFLQWARDSSVRFGVCSRYNARKRSFDPSCGPVVYPVDLARFLQQAAA